MSVFEAKFIRIDGKVVQLQALFRSSSSTQQYSCQKNSAWHTLWYMIGTKIQWWLWLSSLKIPRSALCKAALMTSTDMFMHYPRSAPWFVESTGTIFGFHHEHRVHCAQENIWPGPTAQDFTMMSPVVAKIHCSKHWYRVCSCYTPAVRCYHLFFHLISGPLAISCLWQDWIQLKICSWSLSVWS